MNFPYYAYITIVLFSAFSLGTVALALVLNAKSRQVSNALFKLGYLLTVGTILWTITPRHEVVPSGRSIVYLVGLIFAGIGGAGIVRKAIRVRIELVEEEELSKPDKPPGVIPNP